jgi:hypothetical protein
LPWAAQSPTKDVAELLKTTRNYIFMKTRLSHMRVVKFSIAIACIVAILIGCAQVQQVSQGERPARENVLYIASDGNETWTGQFARPNKDKTDGPFATLERARDEIRKIKKTGGFPEGGITVELGGGAYELHRPFELTSADSGMENKPIVYRGRRGEEVRIVGGKEVTGFKPVTDPAVLSRLDPEARGQVLQADLRALGITDFGQVKEGCMELFFKDKPMTLARWPNEGFVNIVDTVGGSVLDVRGTKGDKIGKFTYDGDRPKRWIDERDIWLHGYWFWDWQDGRQKVESIDTEQRVITLAKPHHVYGYRKNQWFYAYNVLAELDTAGEWYIDRETGILYFWPPEPLENGKPIISILDTLVTMKETKYVTFRGMTFEASRGTAITISGGANNQIVGCTIRNCNGAAVSISGKANGIVGCDIYQIGEGGISLNGGDRRTLTPAGLFAENNHIHHYGRWTPMYRAGISVSGVGNRVAHNLIDNAPHQAIAFSGNDHAIEFNEIHSVCYEANDAGAIYAGRDWTMRGTDIRYNYIHHIYGHKGRGAMGVYLDDMYSGTNIYGNLFYRVPRGVLIGGGRDCTIENNIFVDCNSAAVHVDARALGWARDHTDRWILEGRVKGTLMGIRYRELPYSARYPKLAGILNDEPATPRGNVIVRNVNKGGKWDEIDDKSRPFVTLRDNLINEDPLFEDAEHQNFQLRDDSPAYKLGFKRIPIEKIGLYNDDKRASWPVSHTVRLPEAMAHQNQ